jgi:hypothetical protein
MDLVLRLRGGGGGRLNFSYNGNAFSVHVTFSEAPVAQIKYLVAQKLNTAVDAILLRIGDEILEDGNNVDLCSHTIALSN